MKKIFKLIIILFFVSANLFSFMSTTQDSLLYSEIISFQDLQVSTKSFLDTSIECYYPQKTSYSSTGETVNTGFYNYIEYMYWQENPLLSCAQVSPKKGIPGGSFTFSVVYQDSDPPASGYPKVRIFRDEVEVAGSPFTLAAVSGNYQTGLVCSTTVVLSVPSDNYKFYFYTYDIYNLSSQTEYIYGPIVNTPPQLSWDLEQGFQTDGVEPDFGVESTTFYFRIKYTDVDNHQPASGYPKVYILKEGTTVQVLTLDYVTGLYTTGAIYSAKTNLPLGIYSCYFVAYDSLGECSNIMSSTGPIVNGPCEIKVVNYTQEVAPNENFVVYLKYKDVDSNPPADGYPKISFYLNDELIHEATMQFVNGDYQTGATYSYVVNFSAVSSNYYFVCSAMDNAGVWPVVQTEKKNFVVSTPPTPPQNLTNYEDKNNTLSVSSKVTLKWSSYDPDSNDKITYQLYFGESQDDMKKIYEGENTNYIVYNLKDNKTYYWYIVAIDDTGRKTQSEMFSFSTIGIKPDNVFNYPNPVNAKKAETTNIVFYSDENTTAEIYICTLFGEIIFKDNIEVYKGSNVYPYKPNSDIKSGSYKVVIRIGSKVKKGYILVLNR